MARESDGGTGSRIRVFPQPRAEVESPWSLMSWPRPDPTLMPDPNRAMAISPERLFYRDTGILAYGPNKPHPVDEERNLVTWDELRHPPAPKRPRGRPRKHPKPEEPA